MADFAPAVNVVALLFSKTNLVLCTFFLLGLDTIFDKSEESMLFSCNNCLLSVQNESLSQRLESERTSSTVYPLAISFQAYWLGRKLSF